MGTGPDPAARRFTRSYEQARGTDITALMAADLIETLFTNVPVGLAVLDHDLRYVRINPALAAINGLPVEEHLGRTVAEVLPALAPALEPRLRSVLATGTATHDMQVTGETWSARGQARSWQASYCPIHGPDGATIGVGVAVTEVTEQAGIEAALRRSATRFRSLVRHASDIIVVLDASGTLTYVSPSVERLLGYRAEDWIGKNPFNLIHPDDLDRIRQAFAGVTAQPGEYRPIQFRIRAADGSWRNLEARANNLLHDPDVAGVIETLRDITRQKRLEEAQRVLAEASTALASSLDYESTLQDVAALMVPTLADWCAVDVALSDELPGAPVRRLAIAAVDPAKERQVRALREEYPIRLGAPAGVARVLQSDEPELVREVTDEWLAAAAVDARHLDRLRELGMQSIVRVPLTAHGRTFGVLSLVSTESGRQYDLADLALAEAVARRAALAIENARLYHDMQAALAVRDRFFSSVSHELRTPLTSIRAFAQLLHRRAVRAGTPAADPAVDALATIDANVRKMMALIDELLDLSRAQAGRMPDLERTPTDLVALVRREVAAVQRVAPRHRIELATAFTELIGQWDAVRTARVVGNLVGNAVKYSPAGGTVRIELSSDVPLGAAARGGCAVLRVHDDGIGIPARDLPHVFDRFHRGSNVGEISGAGIGLADARLIVESHGGTIAVESLKGRGTTVTVRLPLA